MGERATEVGDLHLATVVVNVADMARAVDFWSSALGYQPREDRWDDHFMMLEDPQRRSIPVSLQLSSTAHLQPVRLHLDLYTSEQSRHVDRLVRLGASVVANWAYPADADFVVLADPDGNEFCVINHPGLSGSAGV